MKEKKRGVKIRKEHKKNKKKKIYRNRKKKEKDFITFLMD